MGQGAAAFRAPMVEGRLHRRHVLLGRGRFVHDTFGNQPGRDVRRQNEAILSHDAQHALSGYAT